jgi:maltose-binding protein MalE
MKNETPNFITWALLFTMMEEETGEKPNNPEYNAIWESFEKQWQDLKKDIKPNMTS